MPKSSKVAFYAVAKGRQTGVYLSWDECEAQIAGFGGARFKKFANAADAEAYVASFASGSAPTSNPQSTSTTTARTPTSPTVFKPYAKAEPKSGEPSSHVYTSDGKRNRAAETLDDESGWDIVYSDGACKGNGKAGSIAGIGVWWGQNDPRNLAERCPGGQTNNRAELIAIVRVLETAPRTSHPLLIKTDSQYSINCFQSWMPKWLAKGFVSSKGEPVKNEALIRYVSALLNQRALAGQKVHLQYVRGHSGEVGNEGADYLANVGATMPELPERNWNALRASLEKAPVVQSPGAQSVVAQPVVVQPVVEPVPVKANTTQAATPRAHLDTHMTDVELQEYADCLLSSDELVDEMLWDDD